MIKAIIFDFGGVILRTHEWHGRRKWEQKFGLAENEVEAIVFTSDMGRQAQLGKVSYAEHWDWLGQHFNLSTAELNEFEADFWAGDVLDVGLITLIRQLKTNYKTGLISNAFDDLRDTLANHFHIDDAFDVIVISGEEGIMKPDARLYQIALDRLGVAPHESIFIDDFRHNIEGARVVGMAGIHFTPTTNLAAELEKFGVSIPQAKGEKNE